MNEMTQESKELFAAEIGRATKRGMTHFAKPCGMPTMHFGKSLEEAEAKARKAAASYCKSHRVSPVMGIQSGAL